MLGARSTGLGLPLSTIGTHPQPNAACCSHSCRLVNPAATQNLQQLLVLYFYSPLPTNLPFLFGLHCAQPSSLTSPPQLHAIVC